MKYAVEVGSVTMIYIPCFIKTLRNSKVNTGESQTHRENGDPISLLLFFQNKKSRLTIIASETITVISRPETFTVLRK
jgi:hypothetical protein